MRQIWKSTNLELELELELLFFLNVWIFLTYIQIQRLRHLVKQQLHFLYDSARGRWSHSHDVLPCTDNEPMLERRSASTKAVDTSWSCKPTNEPVMHVTFTLCSRGRILVKSTIYRSLLIGRDGHLDQSEAYDISYLVREYGPRNVLGRHWGRWP